MADEKERWIEEKIEEKDSQVKPTVVLVEIKFSRKTIERIVEIDEYTPGDNKTMVVSDAINFYKTLMDLHKKGGELYVHYQDKDKEKIFIPKFPE